MYRLVWDAEHADIQTLKFWRLSVCFDVCLIKAKAEVLRHDLVEADTFQSCHSRLKRSEPYSDHGFESRYLQTTSTVCRSCHENLKNELEDSCPGSNDWRRSKVHHNASTSSCISDQTEALWRSVSRPHIHTAGCFLAASFTWFLKKQLLHSGTRQINLETQNAKQRHQQQELGHDDLKPDLAKPNKNWHQWHITSPCSGRISSH